MDTIRAIFDKVWNGIDLNKDDAVALLRIDAKSSDFYELLATANQLSRQEYHNKGYIFAQIGLNAQPCSGNCSFCSLAEKNFVVDNCFQLSSEQVLQECIQIAQQGISDLFLMTTADYSFREFLNIGRLVRKTIDPSIRLIANIGDFDLDKASQLKECGFVGAYHIHRLREGIDTEIPPEQRIVTMNAIKEAGLDLYYCVEPIGPEHTYEELADEMLRARDYGVDVMASMRRTPVFGTPLENKGTITLLELTKVVAVTRLVTRPKRSMNVHEPTEMAMLAGVNQLYAEYGTNPRDKADKTELGRGLNVDRVRNMLLNAEYTL